MDYSSAALDSSVSFPEGSETACVNITILDDSALEDSHSFSVHIIQTDATNIETGSLTYTTVLITDDEGTLYILFDLALALY